MEDASILRPMPGPGKVACNARTVAVRLARPGQTLDLTVLRDGHTLQIPIIAAMGE